jgi:hypothetical protein
MKKITFKTNIAKSHDMQAVELETETGYFFQCKNIKFVAVKEILRPLWDVYELTTGKSIRSIFFPKMLYSRKIAVDLTIATLEIEHQFDRISSAMKKHPIVNP